MKQREKRFTAKAHETHGSDGDCCASLRSILRTGAAVGLLLLAAHSSAQTVSAADNKPPVTSQQDIVENITLYWLTNTAVSSARLYWESTLAFFAPKGVPIPAAVSAFPNEIYTAPRSWTEKAYPKLIHYNRLPKGTHFAAWEQPEFFVTELRTAFRSLR